MYRGPVQYPKFTVNTVSAYAIMIRVSEVSYLILYHQLG